jgi:hypothetical protein
MFLHLFCECTFIAGIVFPHVPAISLGQHRLAERLSQKKKNNSLQGGGGERGGGLGDVGEKGSRGQIPTGKTV